MSINVCPAKAYLTRNTEYLSNMDPYVLFVLGTQKQRTKTKQEAGRKVSWDEKLSFRPEGDNLMLVQVFDEDEVTDDEVGSGVIDLSPYFDADGPVQCSVSLRYDKKPAGKVILVIQPARGNFYNSNLPVLKQKKKGLHLYSPEDVFEMLKNKDKLKEKLKAKLKGQSQISVEQSDEYYKKRQQDILKSGPYSSMHRKNSVGAAGNSRYVVQSGLTLTQQPTVSSYHPQGVSPPQVGHRSMHQENYIVKDHPRAPTFNSDGYSQKSMHLGRIP